MKYFIEFLNKIHTAENYFLKFYILILFTALYDIETELMYFKLIYI